MSEQESTSSEYEFTSEQNKVLYKLSIKVSHVAWIWSLGAILIIVEAILAILRESINMVNLFSIGIGIAFIIYGYYLCQPIDNLQNIVYTKGNDIRETMITVDDFTKAFHIATIVTWVIVAIIGLQFVLRFIN